MKKWKKIALAVIVTGLVIAAGGWYYVFVWSKNHHRDVADEKGIAITAVQLVGEYKKSETEANKKYLDKAIQVNGEITETKLNQDSLITVTLKSADIMSNVYCTLRKGEKSPVTGTTVTIKGICTGMLSDVVLIDAIIVK